MSEHTHAEDNCLPQVRRLLVKVGTRVVTDPEGGLDMIFLDRLARQIGRLKDRDVECLIVTSGAVHLGRQVLRNPRTKETLTYRQAAAAIGQPELMRNYSAAFAAHALIPAQVLLTMDDMIDRQRYTNVRNQLELLLKTHVVPIINENDSVSVEGVTFVENDRLAAIVATKMRVDLLVFLSDQAGLFTDNPSQNPEAQLIPVVQPGAPLQADVGSAGGPESRGGMKAKISAARVAATCGISVVMADGREDNVLLRLCEGQQVGTLFVAGRQTAGGKKPWLAAVREPMGTIWIDEGACRALCQPDGASLLPSGVTSSRGDYEAGDLVSVVGPEGREIARGLVNYSVDEVRRIAGRHSRDIGRILGHAGADEVIHRDNMVLTGE
ncbi:glutamate 5-kinase [bacterium]|nr:glutamate 5-kinase [bacterium]